MKNDWTDFDFKTFDEFDSDDMKSILKSNQFPRHIRHIIIFNVIPQKIIKEFIPVVVATVASATILRLITDGFSHFPENMRKREEVKSEN